MPNQSIIRPVSQRRREKQKGLEAIEFGLWVLLMMPAFVWMFISGMNFIRYIKAGDVTRSAAMLYTKGMDMAEVGMQQVLVRVSNGLNLVVTSSGATGSNTGNGLVILTRVQYLGACGCTNANKYVMKQRIYIGNRQLQISGAGVESFAGVAPSSSWSTTSGVVTNYTTNTSAVVATAFSTLWGTALVDGQEIYVIETYFKPITNMGSGAFDVSGVYNRIFM